MEQIATAPIETELLARFQELNPILISKYIPANGEEEKQAFLAGEKVNPEHNYVALDTVNFKHVSAEINRLGQQIVSAPSLNPKYVTAYENFVEGYKKKTELMRLAWAFKNEQDVESRSCIKNEYMALNIELYGKPDEATYRSLLNEKVSHIVSKNLSGNTAKLRDELVDMTGYTPGEPVPERFIPSNETVEWMHGVVESLYGGMLSHVPEQELFTPNELAEIFRAILKEEFGESALGWTVSVEEAQSINVRASEKRIIIPTNRGEMTQAKVRSLVVHEIGVHVLRSIQGYETDLLMAAIGLSGYHDAEEGLGVVMEQALEGKYVESGITHYITGGAAYYDSKDFRSLFEMEWRLEVLEKAGEEDLTDDLISRAQDNAYYMVMRSMRGTDELPWFKDLAYYNGASTQWKYLESIRGDDLKFMFIFMGKADPTNIEHERTLYETSTR